MGRRAPTSRSALTPRGAADRGDAEAASVRRSSGNAARPRRRDDAFDRLGAEVVTEAERVGAGRERLDGALRSTPTVALIAFISSASVIATPVKPSSPRSTSPSSAELSVAGSSPISRTRMCAVMIAATPASIAARNGGSASPRAVVDRGQLEVRVLERVAVTREVLGAGRDATLAGARRRTRPRGGRRAPRPSRTSGRR